MACDLGVGINGITGDCSNSSLGAFDISIDGTAPDYIIQRISPTTGTTVLGLGITGYSQTGLTAGTYTFNIVDSCSSGNTYFLVNINISSGTCVSIDSTNTTCGFDNGSITATTNNLYNNSIFYLYEVNDGISQVISLPVNTAVFNTLSAGTYYVIADDGGGCSGKSQSCIIKSSTTLNFGLYQVNNSACAVNLGSLYVTGLTGTPPYTYLWSNGQTTPSITGLSDGSYSVVVTDSFGCSTSQGAIIESVPILTSLILIDTQPTCFSATGEATVYISGGTAPYHIQGSNGEIVITFSPSYTFTGLPAGYFSTTVTDAGLCQSTAYTTLLTPSAISVVTFDVTNSNCNNFDGQISISIFGGTAPYTYTLTDSLNNSQIGIQPLQNGGFIFTSLSSDTYTITITDSLNICPYSGTVVISNNVLFDLSAITSGATCNLPNGEVVLSITSGGTGPYRYEINGYDIFGQTGLTYTFQNLLPGNYTAKVTDVNLCQQILPITIPNLSNLNYVLSSLNPLFSNDGEISIFITDGTPPFAVNWSPNVNGQTGLTINNLSAGTYSVTITDAYGCTLSRSITLIGYTLLQSNQTYTISQGLLTNQTQNLRKGPQQMLIEGFKDLTSGDTNCILNSAVFEVEVTLSGVTTSSTGQTFYTATTLNDFPADNLYYDTVKILLLSYSGITYVDIEPIENKITIGTISNPPQEYIDSEVIVGVKVYYDISCEVCALPVLAPFIFTVDTTKISLGSTNIDTFKLPLVSGGSYSFDVDWGDGVVETINTWNDPNVEHTYTAVGTYEVSISGQLSGWTFNNSGDRGKLMEIKQWGILELGDSPGHFYGCVNLELSGTTDFIDLSTTSTLVQTFRNCTSITTINNAEFWDVSTITDMTETFRNATSFNHPIGSWDVSNVTTTLRMFQTAFDFNQDINNWDVSNLVNSANMFTSATSFNQPLNNWNVSNITNMSGMFSTAIVFNQPLSGWNVSNATNMSNMFANATLFNQDISGWDVSNVTNMLSMFANATLFNQDISGWDVSNVTSMSFMLNTCGISQSNYESLLVGWNSLPSLQNGVFLGALGLQYQIGSAADTARSNIIGTYSWTISGDIAVP